ncbi:MAG: hypothetical protein MJE77_02880 [Proteobacteria bacterium]|nr:hypothetical protein [Pseudomonadota bacterium]
MNTNISMKGLASVEHAQPDSFFASYAATKPVPTPIKAGDRLRLQLEVSDEAWLYAVGAFRQAEYWKMGQWRPGEGAEGGIRTPWPAGHILTAEQARMNTMFVIASSQKLDWVENLTNKDCSALVGQMPPDPPKNECDHLYGLFWKVPSRVRGRVPPPVEYFTTADGTRLPAIVASQSGAPYTAVEWLFKPR